MHPQKCRIACWLLPFLCVGCLAAPPGVKDLNTPREFPQIGTVEEWKHRAKDIQEQVLVSCGLWPLPEKTPLNAHISGKIEREGYTIENVYFETYPGFFLAGNLYRPSGKGKGPFPAVLNPHGHWQGGRLERKDEGSVVARCVSFARQGMVAFAYDMAGYNDTRFADSSTNLSVDIVHRQFATNHADQLWNISLMGLQTWNSIRALDFLVALPDVDKKRLACTGASGGGTQTFMLGAADDRLAAQAPVVMVSHIMQGGCWCENAPGLRVEYSNMEIAAAAAPRPQMLVAATGDWTKSTLTIEGPGIAHAYELLKASEKFRYVRFDFGHNYNRTSREAVYGWFDHWLLKRPLADSVPEAPFTQEPDAMLQVFSDGRLPAGALTMAQFEDSLKKQHQRQWEALAPRDKGSLKKYQSAMLPAWRHTLQVASPDGRAIMQTSGWKKFEGMVYSQMSISRLGENRTNVASYWAPLNLVTNPSPRIVVLAREGGDPADNSTTEKPSALASRLVRNGFAVLEIEGLISEPATSNQFASFYTTYNRTLLQDRVRDLVTVCSVARSADPRISFRVLLAGSGRAGLWALLAAPGADAVAADCAGINTWDEATLLEPALFCPGLLCLGGFEGVALLAAPHPLLLYNIGKGFRADRVEAGYEAAKAKDKLRFDAKHLDDDALVERLKHL